MHVDSRKHAYPHAYVHTTAQVATVTLMQSQHTSTSWSRVLQPIANVACIHKTQHIDPLTLIEILCRHMCTLNKFVQLQAAFIYNLCNLICHK